MALDSADVSSTKLPLESSHQEDAVSSQKTNPQHQEQIFSYMDQLRREITENISPGNKPEAKAIIGRLEEEMALFGGEKLNNTTQIPVIEQTSDNPSLEVSDAQRHVIAAQKLQEKLRQRRMKRNDPSSKQYSFQTIG